MTTSAYPTVTLVRQRTARFVVLRLGLPVLVVMLMFVLDGALNHNSGMIVGGLAVLGLVLVIFAVEIPLMLAAQARYRRRLLAQAAPGTWFAVRATPVGSFAAAAGTRQGLLLVGKSGLVYSKPSRGGPPLQARLRWEEIRHLTVRPYRGKPAAALVEASTTSARDIKVRCNGTNHLIDALQRGMEATSSQR